MKDFKSTRYIQLLYNDEEINTNDLEIAFDDFILEVYKFCDNEPNIRLQYFTLQYLKTFLGIFETHKQNEKIQKFIKGTISFIEAVIEWINKPDINMSQDSNIHTKNIAMPIIWTGKVIHLVEFIYGADTLKNFNNGQATIKQVAAYFSKVLGIEIKDPSGCYVSMRERIKESRTSYIDSMREALLERMEKDDEKTYRRKK